MPLTFDELNNRFGFHKGTIEGPEATAPKHARLRQQFLTFAKVLSDTLPEGRAKALALTELETASMWAHKAIAETAPVVVELPSQNVCVGCNQSWCTCV